MSLLGIDFEDILVYSRGSRDGKGWSEAKKFAPVLVMLRPKLDMPGRV